MVESDSFQNKEVREIWVGIIYLNKICLHFILLMKTNIVLTKTNTVKYIYKNKLDIIG